MFWALGCYLSRGSRVRQKVKSCLLPHCTELWRGLGVETGLDSTWATCWLNMRQNVRVAERHRESPKKHCSPWGTAPWSPASHHTTACPRLPFGGLIQATGDERGEEHVCELEVRCGTEYVWARLAQDSGGSCAILHCVQQTVTSKKLSLCQLIWHKVWHASTHWNNGRCKTSWLISHCLWDTLPMPWALRGLKDPGGAVKR